MQLNKIIEYIPELVNTTQVKYSLNKRKYVDAFI